MNGTNQTVVESAGEEPRRLAVYAVSRSVGGLDDYIPHALEAIRGVVDQLVVTVPSETAAEVVKRLEDYADRIVLAGGDDFDAAVYRRALDEVAPGSTDEIVLTGDAWFGPVVDLAPVVHRMHGDGGVWAMVENAHGLPEAFPEAGVAPQPTPWSWTVVRADVLHSPAWREYWVTRPPAPRADEERVFLDRMREAGFEVAFAFAARDYPSADPGLYTSTLLIDDGCPILQRRIFAQYPPFLDRFAVIGREILDHLESTGYPMSLVWQNLARTTPPKSLYAIGGMVEVLPDADVSYDASRAFRTAAIVHVSDLEPFEEIIDRLAHLPEPFDLYLTTTDGKRAAELQRRVDARASQQIRSVDVRVTPASRGRDMSDFFVGCRDVLLSGGYDLVVKLHARRSPRKTVNVLRYFRRYHYENLLDSPGYVANLIALFQREPTLGVVFPPMLHIGYSTMGHGWAGLDDAAAEVAPTIGIHVPLDRVSPLAPFGGMFIGRPEALLLLSNQRWRYADYGRRGTSRFRNLAHLQERLITYAAAERGYHSRTVLTSEHAAISHTALETKIDSLFSTTRGWPVEQIQLMQRAGFVGHGGVVALSRMYVRLNHPKAARVLVPLYDAALRITVALRVARHALGEVGSIIRGRATGGEHEER
jgi:lipopolysaccharide biosynthesis protein